MSYLLNKKKDFKMDGDLIRVFPSAYKRFCLALDLKNEPGLIAEYLRYHSREFGWKEINEGIKRSGIEVMDIYQVDNRLFMICELPVNGDLDEAWEKMGTYERQAEWSTLMAKFQQALPGHKVEWVKMKRIFQIPENTNT